jgi:hypothetical protein
MTLLSDGTSRAREVLMQYGCDVQVIEHGALTETLWEIHKERIDAMSQSLAQLCDLVEGVVEGDIVSESCFTNLLLAERTHRQVRHPFEVLAARK